MGDAIVKPYVTFGDYLAPERSSDIKHEWLVTIHGCTIELDAVDDPRD